MINQAPQETLRHGFASHRIACQVFTQNTPLKHTLNGMDMEERPRIVKWLITLRKVTEKRRVKSQQKP
jgi:hypothetical protein